VRFTGRSDCTAFEPCAKRQHAARFVWAALAVWGCGDGSGARPRDASVGAEAQPAVPLPSEALERLSGTGLYAGGNAAAGLAPDVREYSPRFKQWLDGASARRFAWLPPGATIDTSDADHWLYPTGMRAWQELSRNGVRVETRFLEKLGPDAWRFLTYYWAEEAEAVAVEGGLPDAGGTGHDIPHLVDCGGCHDNVPDRVLGFTALQLEQDVTLPGDAATQAALGYLHANCGACHNPDSVEYRSVDLELWLPRALGAPEDAPVYRTAVGVPRRGLGAASALPTLRIAPGMPEQSAVYVRMASRDPNVQMPPIGSHVVDAAGLAQLATWISGLAAP
jgi:hypothetical protein